VTAPRVVACPHCGKPVEWTSASRWRPFCSERCKMIDLGAWASESYRVPEASPPDADDTGPGIDRDPRDTGRPS
jgi:endogenous inhibitor of DNA gyrase (YacG/DUF329 family)